MDGPGGRLRWERCPLAVKGFPSSVLPSPLSQDTLPLLLALRLWLQLACWAPFLCRERLGWGGQLQSAQGGATPPAPLSRGSRPGL